MNVQLFIPCFIDQLYPQVAFNMVKVLEKVGCTVKYNPNQTCCGQPAFNAGFWSESKSVCDKFLDDFNGTDYIDFPSSPSIFIVPSSGLTSDMLVQSAITKNEVLLNVIDQPQLISSVFVERGKNSALENFRRIGEVSNMNDLVNYGYNFFNIQSNP